MSESKLRVCDFCQCDGRHIMIILTEDEEGYHAYCPKCSCTGPVKDTYDEAFDAWNTRPSNWIRIEDGNPTEDKSYFLTAIDTNPGNSKKPFIIYANYWLDEKKWLVNSGIIPIVWLDISPYTPSKKEEGADE